ncbi:MAG: MMPL family transporter [Actinomycetaceae bacterium]|nr:MMPL family transporter [Actinomycetaceae bacterium]MDY6082905.1 MMPL family transporter [Actinomycetaceae bacterium]
MSTFLLKLGRSCARHGWRVLGAWVVIIGVLAGIATTVGMQLTNDFEIGETESMTGLSVLKERLPQAAGTAETILITSRSSDIASHKSAIHDYTNQLSTIDGIDLVSDPFSSETREISEDGTAVLIQAQADQTVAAYSAEEGGKPARVKASIARYSTQLEKRDPALTVHVSGTIGQTAGIELSKTEALGVGIAAIVLFIVFTNVLAAATPIITAFLGVATGMLAILIAATVVSINAVTPVLAVMIGLAVGIDYALFLLSRAREYLRAGHAPTEAAGRAVATAGSAVVFAGMTVIIALCGLAVARIPFLTAMGISAALMVAVAVSVALTAVPAIIGLLGYRLISVRHARYSSTPEPGGSPESAKDAPERLPSTPSVPPDLHTGTTPSPTPTAEVSPRTEVHDPHHGHSSEHLTLGSRWINMVMRAPWAFAVGITALLAVATAPVSGLSLTLVDAGYEPQGSQMRQTYDDISEKFGEGYNAPIIVIADMAQSTDPLGLVERMKSDIAALPGVSHISLATPNPDGTLAFIQIIPEGGQASPSTQALVKTLRAHAPSLEQKYGVQHLMVTGVTAVAVDIASVLNGAMLPFGIVVVGLSLILLMIVFRSLAVPLSATIGYVLSLGAGLGSVGAIFGWGWFADFLKVTKVGSVISFLPVIVMGILFGLAMDYEVFLVSRMREVFTRTHDARRAVHDGFVASSRVVCAAALIMTSVFAFFIPEGNKYIKPIAVALTVGIFFDAFLVRMTLIPAVMTILGERAWSMPRVLERWLPTVDVEGVGLERALENSDWTAQHGSALVRMNHVRVQDRHSIALQDVNLVLREGQLGYTRVSSPLAASALAAIVTGRLQPTGGIAVIAGHVLPDGVSAIQGISQQINHYRMESISPHSQLVVAIDPGTAQWHMLNDLIEAGHTVLAILTGDASAPDHISHTLVDTRAQADHILKNDSLQDSDAGAQQTLAVGRTS